MANPTQKQNEGASAPAPTVKVEVTEGASHPTPEKDAEAARPAREAAEKAAKAQFDKLEADGKLEVPVAITGYEHERAKLGADPEEAEPAKAKKAE